MTLIQKNYHLCKERNRETEANPGQIKTEIVNLSQQREI